MMIRYTDSCDSIESSQLYGFFSGWPNPPSSDMHLGILLNSQYKVLAIDVGTKQVVGFITAISDGILCSYVSLFEVLETHRGKGIGSELLRRLLDRVKNHYMVDLICDPELADFYARFDLQPVQGMAIRNYAHQSGIDHASDHNLDD